MKGAAISDQQASVSANESLLKYTARYDPLSAITRVVVVKTTYYDGRFEERDLCRL